MRRQLTLARAMFALAIILGMTFTSATVYAGDVRFSVLMHTVAGSHARADGEARLRAAIERAQASNPAFIVVNGLKDASEPCSEPLFRRRKAVLEASTTAVFLSMAGSDWLNCRDRRGRPAETVWLGLLRDQLYGGTRWDGPSPFKMRRQSAVPAFRNYAENSRWSTQRVMFVTMHAPAPNNHFIMAAGRNSEFEDRLIANRDWLKRLAQHASAERYKAIVMFCDGRIWPPPRLQSGQRDGFREIRSALRAFADKLRIPVLVVAGSDPESSEAIAIERFGKLSYLNIPNGVWDLDVDINAVMPFSLITTDPSTRPTQ